MITGNFPCVRAGKTTLALKNHGYRHDGLATKYPRQFEDAFRELKVDPFMTRREMGAAIREHPAEILHVHNEPNWPVVVAKENAGGRPVIMNVHDVTCARPQELIDKDEEAAFAAADAFVWVSEQQRAYALDMGLPGRDKPYVCIGNFVSSSMLIGGKPLLPHLGGLCYAGGTDPRSGGQSWRDYSPLADALDGQMHFYPGNVGTDYGIVHDTVMEYPLLMHRIAQHDWGFVGTYNAQIPAHQHSVPNKVFDYFAAGIPIIAMNAPLTREYVELGMGLYAGTIGDVRRAVKLDPKPYRRGVMDQRERFTMEARIGVVEDLYEQLLGGA